MSDLYGKIMGPFKRFTDGPNRNKLNFGQWSDDTFRALADVPWDFSEKIDGTNIRIIWDGYKVTIGGRTDNAQIPAGLVAVLQELFPEEALEQQFGITPVVLFGEGFGAGIQKVGVNYGEKQFALFDVLVKNESNPIWLRPGVVSEVAEQMGLQRAPEMPEMTLLKGIEMVQEGLYSKWDSVGLAEGVVGTPVGGFLDRRGHRVIVKLKTVDLYVS